MVSYTCWICSLVYILYCVHDGYVVLCANGVVRMLDMQCCVHRVLITFFICSGMYIWCCVHDCTSGTVSMWCHLHVLHIVLCVGGVVYM